MKDTPILFTPDNAQKVHLNLKPMTRRLNGLEDINKDPSTWAAPRLVHHPDRCDEQGMWYFERGVFSRYLKCPYGTVGDRMWVRESIYIDHFEYTHGPLPKEKPALDDGMLIYRGDGTCCQQFSECECGGKGAPWRPSIHMPKWACRTWLELTAIRVERVQEITEEDAKKEGADDEADEGPESVMMERYGQGFDNGYFPEHSYYIGFQHLWISINGKDSWDLNPWVWVLSFRKVQL